MTKAVSYTHLVMQIAELTHVNQYASMLVGKTQWGKTWALKGGVFAANGYTFSSLIENHSLTGDDKEVSGFLGALLAGFLAGIIVNLLKKAFSWLPKSNEDIKM